MFFVCFFVFSTSVRRDPVTGQWIKYSGQLSDLGIKDPRASAGGDGGDFFGGFDIIDSRNSEQNQIQESFDTLSTLTVPKQQEALVPTVGVKTTEFGSRKSKFVSEIPITASADDESNLVQISDSNQVTSKIIGEVQRVSHPYIDQQQIDLQTTQGQLPLKPIPLGNVCRFGGYAPISGCPIEATNGCVDRIPCTRKCDNGAYFSWRCLGPVILSPEEANKLPEPEIPQSQQQQQDQAKVNEQAISELARSLETAVKNNDFTSLAKIILQAQHSSHANNFAATQLIQSALQAQSQIIQAANQMQTQEQQQDQDFLEQQLAQSQDDEQQQQQQKDNYYQ